jgi:energy-coupling factor transporter ATP-binding protein EcfA2
MYNYGRKWQEALQKVLMRLAFGDGHGFLVIEGPDASGKTDLLTAISYIVNHAAAISELPNGFNGISQIVHEKRYLRICLEDTEEGNSIPMSILSKLVTTLSEKGLKSGQPILIMWDNIDMCLESPLHQHESRKFLEEIHRSLGMYEHLTFICTVTADDGAGSEILGISAGPEHFLKL